MTVPSPDPIRALSPSPLSFTGVVARSRPLSQNGHQGGSGHPPPPRPIRLSCLLRAKIHDYHGPAREEPCVSMIPDTAPSCKTAFNPNSLKDDDLAGRLGLQLKELTKLVTVLDKAGLVSTYVGTHQNRLNTPHQAHLIQTPPERAQRGRAAFGRSTILLYRLPALLQCRQVAGSGNAKNHRHRLTKRPLPSDFHLSFSDVLNTWIGARQQRLPLPTMREIVFDARSRPVNRFQPRCFHLRHLSCRTRRQ